jgi:hypothetical protein
MISSLKQPNRIKQAELHEAVKQALIRLLEDSQIKNKIVALLRNQSQPFLVRLVWKSR